MIYVDKLQPTFDISLTLGTVDTTNPPALRLVFDRKGTNETVSHDVNPGDVTPGERFITISDQPTTIFEGSGQYDFTVYDIDIPAAPVEIEKGIAVITTEPISFTQHGNDKQRGEHK